MNRLVLIVLFGLLAGLSSPVNAEDERNPAVGVEDLRAFADAWGYIKDHYVEAIDDRRLLEAAIRGMLAELDEHSTWLAPEQLRDVEEQATGRFGGLGVRIAVSQGQLQILSAMGDSPAGRAGLVSGDRIVAIDSTQVTEENVSEAVEWLRGAPGTRVALTIEREGQGEPLELSLTREIIRRESVSLQLLEGGLAHLTIRQFQQSTASEVDEAIVQALEQLGSLNGLVLDLRDNPGGMLEAAVAVSDRFLSDQLIVYADGRGKSEALRFTSNPGEALPGVPLVVLVNRSSASAAEILAGALQDHERAVIVGEETYGKGSVQTIWPLRNGAGMRLTTSNYHTPSGRMIRSGGIVPDVRSGSLLPSADSVEDDPMLAEALLLLRSAERLHRYSQAEP